MVNNTKDLFILYIKNHREGNRMEIWWSILKRWSRRGSEGGNLTGRNQTSTVSDETVAQSKLRTEMLAPWINGPSRENYSGVDVQYNHGLKNHLKNLKHIDDVILMGYYLRKYLPKMLQWQVNRAKEPANPFKQQTKRGPFQTPIKDERGNILSYVIWEAGRIIKINQAFNEEQSGIELVELGSGTIEDSYEQNKTVKDYFEGPV